MNNTKNEMINDPYLNEHNCFIRLWEDYVKHGKLVVAVDFDNTIFDLHKKGFEFTKVIELLKDCQTLGFPIVVFSAAPKERHQEIRNRCQEIGINISGVNEDVLRFGERDHMDYSKSKIYFNILLDDRAGLPSAYNILFKVVDKLLDKPDIIRVEGLYYTSADLKIRHYLEDECRSEYYQFFIKDKESPRLYDIYYEYGELKYLVIDGDDNNLLLDLVPADFDELSENNYSFDDTKEELDSLLKKHGIKYV